MVQCWFNETSIGNFAPNYQTPLPILLLIHRQNFNAGSVKPKL